ncbi:MAG: iron ABC transporter permease [Leptospirales bacterium]|nr:iron ABC transporter permease [Leptospirales bacterium]
MKKSWIFIFLAVILCVIFLVSLSLGKYPAAISDIVRLFAGKINAAWNPAPDKLAVLENLIYEIRLPRILAAILIGAGLSVSGAAFQAMFVNPLVSPSLLGVLAGSSFGAALGMVMGGSYLLIQALSFVFGCFAVLLSIFIASIHKGNSLLLLVLGGVISGAFFTSLLSVLKYIADPYNQLPAITHWLMGSLSFSDKSTLFAASFPIIAGLLIMLLFSGYINALSLGDDEAKALGVPVAKIRFGLIGVATAVSAMTVVLAGIIGWVGLVIPHVSRMIVGPDNKRLIPVCALIGASYLLAVDNVSRLAFDVEIPIGITTSLIGIPFFVILLRQAKRGWS